MINAWSVVLLIALFAPAMLILNGLIQRRRSAIAVPGWLSGSLALITVLAGGALAFGVAFGGLDASFLATLFVLGAAELPIGLAVWFLIERHAVAAGAAHSFGVLIVALGSLTAVMVLFIPVLPGQLALTQSTPTLSASSPLPISLTRPVSSPSPSPVSPTATATVTQTPQPLATATPAASPTRVRYATPTPSPTLTPFPACGATTLYNVNLRAEPALDAPIMNVIPYQSVIEVAGRDQAGAWWFARYDGEWGWLDGSYLTLDTDCSQAPVLAD